MSDPVSDIFVLCNRRDRAVVEQIAVPLRQAGGVAWLDAVPTGAPA